MRKRSGQASVELAFVALMLVGLLFTIAELAFLFMEHQRVLGISREIASAIYRECPDSSNKSDCVEEILRKVKQGAAPLLRDFNNKATIIGNFYFENPNLSIGYISRRMEADNSFSDCLATNCTSGENTKYNISPAPVPTLAREKSVPLGMIQYQKNVAVGEVYYQHTAITPIHSMLGTILPEDVYESTTF